MKILIALLFLASSAFAGVVTPGTISGAIPDTVSQSTPVEYWNAFDLSGLAEGASVTSWTGRNGSPATSAAASVWDAIYNGTGTYSSSAFGGAPGVTTTGSSLLVSVPTLLSGTHSGLTFAVVMWPKSTSNLSSEDWFLSIGGNNSNSNRVVGKLFLGTTANPELSFGHLNGQGSAGKARLLAGKVANSLRPLVIFYTFDGTKTFQSTPGLLNCWVNGVCVDAQTNNSTTLSVSGQVAFGNVTPGNGLAVSIGAVAVWNRTLEAREIRKLSAYLNDSFVRDNRPRCIVVGDSIAEGSSQSAGGTIVDQLQAAIPQVRFENCARGGKSQATQVGGASPYDNLIASMRPEDIGLIWPGSIDLASNGTAVATVIASQASIVSKMKAQGSRVVQLTMIPKQPNTDVIDQATLNTRRASLNASLNNPANSGADATVDLTTISGFDTDLGWQSVTNYVTVLNTVTGTDSTGSAHDIALPNFGFRVQRVDSVKKVSDNSDVSGNFSSTILADGLLHQTSGNLAGVSLNVVINDGSHVVTSASAAWVTPIAAVILPMALPSASITGILVGTNGGTGVNNGARTLTLGANLATTGTSATTFALPSSGTPTYTWPSTGGKLIKLSTDASGTLPASGNFVYAGSDGFLSSTANMFIFGAGNLQINSSLTMGPGVVIGSTAGTGLYLQGSTNGVAALGGGVGEVLSSSLGIGSEVTLTTATAANVTSKAITAGNWLVWGVVYFDEAGTTTATYYTAGINSTSATLPGYTGAQASIPGTASVISGYTPSVVIAPTPVVVNAGETLYLVCQAAFAVSTLKAYGVIYAQRIN